MSSQNDYAPVGQQESWLARLLTHRSMELLGLCLLILAVCIGLSLFTYNPNDPSFNAATGTQPTNLLGRAGATIANSLIEWLGLSSILPIIILLAWTWRLVRYHHINAPILRLISAFLLLPACAFLIGTAQLILPGLMVTWPSSYGLGGSCGVALARYILNAMESMMGAAGGLATILIALLLVGLLMPLTLNLYGHEWRALGRVIWFIGRMPFRLLRRGAGTKISGAETDHEAEHVFSRYSHNGPVRPRQMMGQQTARPSGFLRYHNSQNAAEHAKRMETNPAIQSWISPPSSPPPPYTPQDQTASHPHATSLTSSAPPVEEEETNPYRKQLRSIQRDSEREDLGHTASIIDADYHDIDEEELDTRAQADPPRKMSLLERLTGKHSEKHPDTAPSPNSDKARAANFSGFERSHGNNSLAGQQNGRADLPTSDRKDVAKAWEPPSLGLLDSPPPRHLSGPDPESLSQHARLLEGVLNDYGVQGRIRDYHSGPVVTLYELEPAPGVRTQRVIGLSDDIARSLSVLSVRIATIPGRNVIGIEVPNPTRETVYFPELLHTAEWRESKSKLELALGKDIAGKPIYADLAKMPHLLVAGTTGSGKSVGVNAMILSLLYRLSPEECRLIMIDPKILELSIYEGIPHLMTPVVTEPAKAVSALKWAVQEMDRRYRLMAEHQVRNISGYNDRIRRLRTSGETPTRRVQTGFDPETGRPVFDEHRLALEHLPYIVVIIDEMADLMMAAGKEIEAAVLRLAQKARAAGIHVIMATQRPSVDVITGTIKANFPTRISFQVTNKFDSRTILQEQGAEQLLGRGDMLFMQGGGRITRVHGPFISDEEVERVVDDLRSKGQPVYNTDVIAEEEEEPPARGTTGRSGDETSNDLYDQAVELVMREKKASTSFIQRHLSIGYNRAANIIDQMEREGIIGPANHVGRREILKTSYFQNEEQDEDYDSE